MSISEQHARVEVVTMGKCWRLRWRDGPTEHDKVRNAEHEVDVVLLRRGVASHDPEQTAEGWDRQPERDERRPVKAPHQPASRVVVLGASKEEKPCCGEYGCRERHER